MSLELVRIAAEKQSLSNLRCSFFDVCSTARLPPADLVFASDLMYSPRVAFHLGKRCAEACARGSTVLVGDPGRPGRAGFLMGVKEGGAEVCRLQSRASSESTIDILYVGVANKG